MEEAFKATPLGQLGPEQRLALRNVIVVFVITILLGYLGGRIGRWLSFAIKVNRLPGPGYFQFLIRAITQNQDSFNYIVNQVREHGEIFRVWFGVRAAIFVTKPEYIEAIISTTSFNDKSFGYRFIEPWLGQGLLTVTGDRWHVHRRLLASSFHFKILEGFNEVFNAKTQILMEKLDGLCKSGKAFDVHPYITLATLDVVCETAMGIDIKAQDDHPSDYVESIYEVTKLIAQRCRRPWLFSDFIYNLTTNGKEAKRRLQILHSFTSNVISERRKMRAVKKSDSEDSGKKKRLAFLDMLLEIEEDGKGLSEVAIREEVDTFMFAGHDTTSITMCWVLLFLGLHQDKQDLVYKELYNIFQGEERFVTTSDAAEMVYLERFIKETLRLYPTVPFIGRNITEDVQVGEYILPANVSYMIQVHELHKDPKVFPNPEIFNPDNFLPEKVRERHPYAYIPFSAGPRNCIGQRFALLEEKVMLSKLLMKYRVISLDRREDIELTCDIILKSVKGINIKLEYRP